ncbi:MAG: cytidylate kinase-like family protein [Gemmatimonadetes bacterium]|nr:cytidylate kinase-like family protein [Gemmatimonadota bacterium]
MTVITIEGRIGSGTTEVGRLVAKELEIDYVDRLLLADIARRVGTTVEALADTERRVPSRASRFAYRIQRMLQRSAVAGMGGDPYFGPGIETLLARPYHDLEEPPATSAEEVDERRFIDTTREVITDLAEIGNVVILSRGGAAILRDRPSVLRVGLTAHQQDRVRRIMERERLTEEDAVKWIEHSDSAQLRYFKKAFNTCPLDRFLYHFMLHTSEIGVEYATKLIVDTARLMTDEGLPRGPEPA